MEHLVKLLRDSYDLQEEKSEETAYWHLQKLRSEIKQLTLTDVVKSDSEQLHTEVFNLANKLAINGYGNEAVKMHGICNGM
jgi:restriction endonuclease Mrr